jgi:hypothetical protein
MVEYHGTSRWLEYGTRVRTYHRTMVCVRTYYLVLHGRYLVPMVQYVHVYHGTRVPYRYTYGTNWYALFQSESCVKYVRSTHVPNTAWHSIVLPWYTCTNLVRVPAYIIWYTCTYTVHMYVHVYHSTYTCTVQTLSQKRLEIQALRYVPGTYTCTMVRTYVRSLVRTLASDHLANQGSGFDCRSRQPGSATAARLPPW